MNVADHVHSSSKFPKDVLRRKEAGCGVTTHFEGVEAGDDSPVLHLAAFGRMGELTFRVGSGTGASLELATHLQRQPFRVPDGRHIYRHFGLKAKKKNPDDMTALMQRKRFVRFGLCTRKARRDLDVFWLFVCRHSEIKTQRPIVVTFSIFEASIC